MTPEQVREYAPTVLSGAQRESYFENGYLLAESIVPMEWVERMRKVTDEMVAQSRSQVPGHSPRTV